MSPNNHESQLTSRQLNILLGVVKEYCDTGNLVGSNQLKQAYNFDFSSATVRNELAVLKKLKYITQPFTSSGSKPTELGFRVFVEELMKGLEMTTYEQRKLKQRLSYMEEQQKRMEVVLSKFLAAQSGGVGFSVHEDSSFLSGLPSLLTGQDKGTESVASILNFLDNLPSYREFLLEHKSDEKALAKELKISDTKTINQITTIIGKENPVIPLSSDYGLAATEVTLPDGNKTVVGIIANNRILVNPQNLALIQHLSKLLSKSSKKEE